MTWPGEVPHRAEWEQGSPALANHLIGHRDRSNDAVRLHRGQPIGSGPVEGTINRRMKRSGARRRLENVARFVELCAIADGRGWDHPWSSAA